MDRGVGFKLRGGAARRFVARLVLLTLAGAAAAGPGPPSVSDPLEALLGRLSQRGALYEKAALGFSCEETVVEGKFGGQGGENRREVKTRYDYLCEGNPQSGYEEIRILVSKDASSRGRRVVNTNLGVPGAYAWSLLFTDLRRPHFRFELEGEELLGFHLAAVVAFTGAAPFAGGREIEEWSGRVWVDQETGNFLKVVATPNNQDDLLRLRMAAWLKSIQVGAVRIRRQPRGYRYELTFTVEKFGLTFPGEAETRVFVLTPEGQEEIREKTTQRFENYVFFNVHSEEEFRGTETQPGRKPAP